MTLPAKNGFTLLELIITISITSILFVLAIPSYRGFQANQQLTQAVETLKSDLRFAQSQALAGVKNANCTPPVTKLEGWYIRPVSQNSYQIFSRCEGRAEAAYRAQPTSLGSGMTIGSSVANGAFFRPVNQASDGATYTLIANGQAYSVTVSTVGDISSQKLTSVPTPMPTNAPATPTPTPTQAPIPTSTPIPTQAPTLTPTPTISALALCADGTNDKVYSSTMVGCNGTASSGSSNALCSATAHVCSVPEYVAAGGGVVSNPNDTVRYLSSTYSTQAWCGISYLVYTPGGSNTIATCVGGACSTRNSYSATACSTASSGWYAGSSGTFSGVVCCSN